MFRRTSPDADLLIAVDNDDLSGRGLDGYTITVQLRGEEREERERADQRTHSVYTYLQSAYEGEPDRLVDKFIDQMRYAQHGDWDGARAFRPHIEALEDAEIRSSDEREYTALREIADELRERLHNGEAPRARR